MTTQSTNPMTRLNEWKAEKPDRAVKIAHPRTYRPSGWTVSLSSGQLPVDVIAYGAGIQGQTNGLGYENVVSLVDYDADPSSELPGIEEVVAAALDCFAALVARIEGGDSPEFFPGRASGF